MDGRPKFWIHYTLYICPICGRGEYYKQRIYDRPAPIDPDDREDLQILYDWCEDIKDLPEIEVIAIDTPANL